MLDQDVTSFGILVNHQYHYTIILVLLKSDLNKNQSQN